MGRPDADPPAYESQTEYELQPQEYESNQEPTRIPDEHLAANYPNDQQDQQYHPQQQQVQPQQQQLQPFQQQQVQPQQQQLQPFQQQQVQPQQQQQQPFQQQHLQPQHPQPFQPQQFQTQQALPQVLQQPAQYRPLQPNQAYPPQQPAQYPPPQPNQAYPSQQPAQYPPPQPNQAYPPQQQPAQYPPQPVQYQTKNPPTNQMHPNVSPLVMQQTGYARQASLQGFPQPGYLPPQQFDQGMPPASPHKPGGQTPAEGIPVGGDGWRTGLFDFMDDPMNGKACHPFSYFQYFRFVVHELTQGSK